MKIKFKIFLPFLFFCVPNHLFSQTKERPDSLRINIILPKQIRNNDDLKAQVVIKNISDKRIDIYKDLSEGDLMDEYANISFIVEEKRGSGFSEYLGHSFFDPYPSYDTLDNAEKIWLSPYTSVTAYYHLDNVIKFEKGYYRMKCLYRNNIRATKRIESNWTYFRLLQTIYVKHYFD